MSESVETSTTDTTPEPMARRRSVWPWLKWPLAVGALLLGLVLLLVGGLWGAAHSEWGTQRVLTSLSGVGVRVTAPRGGLLGDFQAERVEVDLPRGGVLRLEGPAWQGLTLVPDMEVAWLTGVRALGVQVRQVQLDWVAGPPSTAPLQAPTSLSLPLSLHVGRVQVGAVVSNLLGSVPLVGLDAGVALHDGVLPTRHRVRLHQLSWGEWQLQGQADVGVRGRMLVDAAVRATGQVSSALKARADVRLKGPLADLGVQAQAKLQRGEQAGQAVDVDAQVQAFAPWPVSSLKAKLDRLNLADLHADLPRTALQGEVAMAPAAPEATSGRGKIQGAASPLGRADVLGRVALHNSLSGAWDQQRLPVREWQGTLKLARAIEARSIDDVLAGLEVDWQVGVPRVREAASAQLKLSGGWGPGRHLKLTLSQVEPQALHTLAPALRLQGEVSLTPAQGTSGAQHGWRETVASLRADLTGSYGAAHAWPERAKSMPGGSRPVAAHLAARYAPGEVSVSRLALSSAGAMAVLRDARWRWAPPVLAKPETPRVPAWHTAGELSVRDFDPQLWLPWPQGAGGRNQLSADAHFELDGDWRGSVSAQLASSWLAGVPVQGTMQWQSPRAPQTMSLKLDLSAAGNHAKAQAQMPWTMDEQGRPRLAASSRWQAEVSAAALQALQPLATLVGARQLAGAVNLNTQGQGWWPRVSSAGQVRVQGLRWLPKEGAGVSLASAQAEWGVDLRGANSAVAAKVDVQQVQVAGVEVVEANARLNGSAQSHQGTVQVTLLRKPPTPVASDEAPPPKPERLTAELALHGGLSWTESAHAWQGQLQDLVVRLGQAPGREALRLQPMPLQWRQDARAESLKVGSTRMNLMGAVLHLRQAAWTWADRQRDPVGVAELDLELEAFNLPELLDRWQPQAGWGGDLILQGAVKVRHNRQDPWSVDATVQRKSGDISLSEPTIEGNSAQRLGIREARVNLQARRGTWILTEWFEGRALGKLVGRQVVQAQNPTQGPQGTDPLSGELDLSIDNLRPWGTWIPAGWRVSGRMQARAELAGTLGAPRYSGQVVGENLGGGQALLGVNLTDGKLQMSLRGDLVVLQHFEARGGSAGGLVTAQGQASFGDIPQARLSLTADRFPLLQRVDRRLVISGVVNGALNTDAMEADGHVRVDEGLIDISKSSAPTIGDDVTVLNRPAHARPVGDGSGNGAPEARKSGPQRKLIANLDVDLGKKLRIKGMGLDALLTGGLKVTTPSNRPALQGTIRVEDGTYAAYGQKLVVERGTLAFTGPIENPRLDILAMRAQSPMARNSDVKVGVAITGTAQDPRVRLYSEPSMSETEKLSWLVLGRAPTGLGGADIGLLQTAAVALLSGEGASPSDNLIGMLGLDEFSLRQTDTGVRETVVNVGKQVSRHWYLGYERNLNATGGNWQLIYTLARRFTLRLQAGVDNAADLIWSWRWD